MNFANLTRNELVERMGKIQAIALDLSHLADYNDEVANGPFDPFFPAMKTDEIKAKVDELMKLFYK